MCEILFMKIYRRVMLSFLWGVSNELASLNKNLGWRNIISNKQKHVLNLLSDRKNMRGGVHNVH